MSRPAEENLAKSKRCTRGWPGSARSWPDGRLAVVDSISVDAPKTKLLAAKFKAMGLDSVLVIADSVDENLALASRNLANVLVIEPRYADPLSLVFYKKVLVTKGAIEQLKEMFA